jgi:hypothetical protein
MKSVSVTCRCGKVEIGVTGSPIMAVSCFCADCRRAGEEFEKLPGAPKVLDPDGGTPAVLYRKDRVRCVRGKSYLEERRLTPGTPTRRVFAACCNSAMFGEFTKGHWLSMYRHRFAAGAPLPEMRIMTKDRRAGMVLPNDLPNHERFSGTFMLKLMAAWIAMGLRNPATGMDDIPRSNS